MPKRRNRKYTRQQPVDQPDNWQEAMERGVFLLNERNRGFVDYVSPEVYLPPVSHKSLIFQVLAIIVFGAFFVGYLYSLHHNLMRQEKLNQLVSEGVDTQATVINRWETLVSAGKAGSQYKYTLAFRYEVAGADYFGAQDVGFYSYSQISIGNRVTVRYLPDEPTTVMLWGSYGGEGNLPPFGVSTQASWWWALLVAGIAILVAGGYVAYRLSREARQRRSLVVDGRLLFVPLTGCVVTKRFLWDPHIHLAYDLVSPVTSTRLGGRYVGDWTEERSCPTEGMVAVVLFRDDRHYQVL